MSKMEMLRARLEESRKQRERKMVHPQECKCGGWGNIPMSQFSIGYVKCEV